MEEFVIMLLIVKVLVLIIPLLVLAYLLRSKRKRKYRQFYKIWDHQEIPGNYYDVLIEKNPAIKPKETMLN